MVARSSAAGEMPNQQIAGDATMLAVDATAPCTEEALGGRIGQAELLWEPQGADAGSADPRGWTRAWSAC